MELTLSIDGAPVGRADRDARRPRRRRAQAPRAGVGRPARARRSSSSTAGRRASCAGRARSPARSPSDFRLVTFDNRGHGMSEKPPDAEHYGDARLWADDVAAVIEQTGWTARCWSPGPTAASRHRLRPRLRRGGDRRHQPRRRRRDAARRRLRPHRPGIPRERPRRLLARPGDEHRRHPPLPRACTAQPLERGGLEHGAVLEHGRAPRGPRGADLPRDRRRRRPVRPVRAGARDARARGRDRPAVDGRARPRRLPDGRASWYDGVGHLPFLEDPAVSTASSPRSRPPRAGRRRPRAGRPGPRRSATRRAGYAPALSHGRGPPSAPAPVVGQRRRAPAPSSPGGARCAPPSGSAGRRAGCRRGRQPRRRRPGRPSGPRRPRQGGLRVRGRGHACWDAELGASSDPAVRREPHPRGARLSGALVGERWRVGTSCSRSSSPGCRASSSGSGWATRVRQALRGGRAARRLPPHRRGGRARRRRRVEVDLDALPTTRSRSGSSPTRSSSISGSPRRSSRPRAPAVPARVAVGTRRRRGRLTHRPGAAEVRRPVRGPPQRGRHRAAREPTEVLMRSSPRAHQRISRSRRWWGALAVVALVALAVASSAVARRSGERGGDGSRGLGHYVQRDLVSDVPGAAELHDPTWSTRGASPFGPTTPAWVADNGKDVSTLYSGARRLAGGEGAADGLDPGRRTDRHGVQRRRPASSCTPARAPAPARSCSPPRRGRSPAGTRPSRRRRRRRGADGRHRAGRDLQGARDRRHRRPARSSTRPTSTTAAVDVCDANFAPVHRPGAFEDPAIPRGLRAVRHPGGRRQDLRHLRQAGRRRRGRRRRAGPRLRRRLRHQRRRSCAASPRAGR